MNLFASEFVRRQVYPQVDLFALGSAETRINMDYNQNQNNPYGWNQPNPQDQQGSQHMPENNSQYNSQNQFNSPYNDAPQERSANGFAIASLILGIASIVLCCSGILSIITGALSILFAILSRRKNKKMPGMSVGGIVTSIFGLLFGIIALVYWIFIFALMEDPELRQRIDPIYEETYGMTFEEYMETMGVYFD